MGMVLLAYHNFYFENAPLLVFVVVLCSLCFAIKLVGYYLTNACFSVRRNIANAFTVHMHCDCCKWHYIYCFHLLKLSSVLHNKILEGNFLPSFMCSHPDR